MIIKYPTGLYLDQLPLKPGQAGAFTWIISTELPRRPNTLLQQIPLTKQLQSSSIAQFDSEERRQVYGKLLFTITHAHTSKDLSNSISFEVGRVLSTSDISVVETLIAASPDTIDIQHNNNKFNLNSAGLSSDDINFIEIQTRAKLTALRSEFNTTKIEVITIQNNIKEYQKLIGELESTIETMELISGSEDILIKLNNRKVETSIKLEAAIVQEEVLLVKVSEIYDNILKVSVLVR